MERYHGGGAFLGVMMSMGVLRLSRIELYWTTKYFEIGAPGVTQLMPRQRFEQLFWCLHLFNNSLQVPVGQPGYDKVFKVRPLMDILVPRFISEYVLQKECSIYEAMVPFKGRFGFKQYMKDKPTKWGIKVFVLADARNKYVTNLQVYTGKEVVSGANDVGLCTKVSRFAGKPGLELYTDNYYTSPILYKHLYEKFAVNACGPCRSNRCGFPPELIVKATKTNRGHYD